jgi:two-component system, LuxR family, sensor kinase FixL
MKRRAHAKPTKHLARRASASAVPPSAPHLPDVQKLLQQSQIFDITQDAIFLWRAPGGIEFWNKGAAELYGYTEDEARGRVSHELLRTQAPVPWPEIENQLRKQGSWHGKIRQCTRDKREIVVSARFQRVPQSGKGMLILESTRDITETKRSQERLERQLREQAVSVRFSLDALRATNIQTICDDAAHLLVRELKIDFSSIFECSSHGESLLLRSGAGWRCGYVGIAQLEAGEATPSGRALELNQSIIIADARKDLRLRLPPFMKEHGVVGSMAVVIEGRGRAFGALSVHTMQPRVFNADDIHFLESIANILATAISRIQFEQELKETAGRLSGIVETAVDGIITIDENGVVETMNPAAEKIFEYSADEVVGKNISMLMPEPYRSEHDGYLEHYHRTGERRIIGIGREVRGRRKDGSEFPMDVAVSVRNLGNRRIFTGLVRDISARKKLEQEILEISDREQRRIGSDLHDDLCQRLAGIRFSFDALKKTLPHTPEGISERIEKIADDVSDAIDRTRMLARGMVPVALEKNGLASALQELVGRITTLFKTKCIFRSKGTIEVKDPIAATHLYRIAQEAVNNAVKHARPRRIVVSLEKVAGKKLLTIDDDGVGFAPQDAQRTAEGMGLRTIAYRAGMIAADVQVQSAIGRGTKIICSFSSDL